MSVNKAGACKSWDTSAPRYHEAGQLAVNTSFPTWAIDELRLTLKEHRRLKKFVRDRDNIDEMPLSKLLELALKINLDDVITRAESWGHSLRYPAFTGHYLFDIAFELLTIRVVRKACVEYEHTPEWEYFDLHKQAPYIGWAGSQMTLYIAGLPEPGSYPRRSKPRWEHVDLGEDVLPSHLWDAL